MQSLLELSRTAQVSEEQRSLLQLVGDLSDGTEEAIIRHQIAPKINGAVYDLDTELDFLVMAGLLHWQNPGWRLSQLGLEFLSNCSAATQSLA